MGNYATTTQLIARFESSEDLAHLTNSEDTGAADTDVLDEVINDAEGQIDSYLAKRYLIPVDVDSDTVLANRMKSLTLDLAVHKLCTHGDMVSEAKQSAHDTTIDYLKELAKGTVLLPSAGALSPTATDEPAARWGTAGAVISGTDQRMFSRASQGNL